MKAKLIFIRDPEIFVVKLTSDDDSEKDSLNYILASGIGEKSKCVCSECKDSFEFLLKK